MRRLLPLLLVAWAVSGMACTRVNPGPCPPVREYDEAFTTEFKAQLEAENPDGTEVIPEGSPVDVFIADQITLRDQVRLCQ